ncbi:protein translocase subunit SecD [Caulobacter sp. 17J65-9]|uniref:protein translocase subunit SecD n=1 Tax=Caulobacter sp. 17J65-9 TaxID=2709382 RepID=UPI0013CAE122|nr:protein translocase subunit SecD [Caulobacter sp. 17J65-9]NEX95056.1 protein translocase subunit SecD [Caulobacter sp. 17J65-9]
MIQVSRWKVTVVALATVFGILFALPNVLPADVRARMPGWLPSKTLNLGLDLQGGSYLLLSVDTEALKRERVTNLMEDVRQVLGTDQIGSSGLQKLPDGVRVRINDPAQLKQAKKALGSLAVINPRTGKPELAVADAGDQNLTLRFTPDALSTIGASAVDQSIEIVRKRVDAMGTREPTILRQGAERIVVQAPGESDPEALKRVIGQTAKLTFQMLDETVPVAEAQAGHVPPGSELLPQPSRPDEPYVLVKRRVLVSGENLTQANVGQDQSHRPSIDFRFDGLGGKKFGQVTADNIGRRFAIVLDGKVISAPTIQSAITGGSGQITGNFTIQEASELVNLLRGGALPAPLKVEEQRTIGAELGKDAVDKGKVSAVLGFALIVVFMILAYGFLFGGIAIIALLLNIILLFAAMTVGQATLTLPGIAGMILTLAVAVDANVLIYERIRDEERSGHSPRAAIDIGFQRALVSIIDANVTSLISALIMFQFGAGPVQGFAWTLLIGVFTSVFSAVLVSQLLLGLWLNAKRPKTLPI